MSEEKQYKDTMELINKLYSELPLKLKRKMMVDLTIKYSTSMYDYSIHGKHDKRHR